MSLCDPDADLRCGTLDCSEPDYRPARDDVPWDALEQSVFGSKASNAKHMRSVMDIQVRHCKRRQPQSTLHLQIITFPALPSYLSRMQQVVGLSCRPSTPPCTVRRSANLFSCDPLFGKQGVDSVLEGHGVLPNSSPERQAAAENRLSRELKEQKDGAQFSSEVRNEDDMVMLEKLRAAGATAETLRSVEAAIQRRAETGVKSSSFVLLLK